MYIPACYYFQPFFIISSSVIIMRVQKVASFSSSEKEEGGRINSPGFLTRKPEKKAAFARKKVMDVGQGDQKMAAMTVRLSRQKRPRQEKVMPSTSLKVINSHIHEEIKYLSPKHTQSTLAIPAQLLQRSGSTTNPNKSYESNLFLANSSLMSTFDEMNTCDYLPTASGISIESFSGKNCAMETAESSCRDWFGLEGENEKLKEENIRLEEQIEKLKEELKEFKDRQFNKKLYGKTEPIRCKRCDATELLEKENRQLHFSVQRYTEEAAIMRQRIEELSSQLKEEKETVTLLSSELHVSRQMLDQLQHLVGNLKEKIQSDSQELRYLNIQQDILLRRKEQFEQFKADSIRKSTERGNLKKVVEEYKEKIEVLRKVIAKNRSEKAKKLEEMEFSLELSMDSTFTI